MFSLVDFLPDPFLITVLDIGAALGETPVYEPLVAAGRARVIGFEPDARECEQLNRNYGAPHRFFPNFIGDGGRATFHETNWTLTGSLYAPNTPLLEKFHVLAEVMTPVAQHPVSTTRLDDVPGIDDVDFIKIDVQGAELQIFQNAPRLLEKCLLIQTEVEFVELYRDQPMFADVDSCLRRAGFQFHTFEGFGTRAFKPLMPGGNPNQGFRQILWADAVYVRDWMRLDRIPDAKLFKFAVLLHDLMHSWDLCRLVLAELDRRAPPEAPTSHAERYLERIVAETKGGG